jgi:antitoxin (DNA-binding transcriptional repressor) of toxin-antitoxin stability system
MSEIKITVTDVARHLSDIISRVAYRGEHFILVKGKKTMARITPVAIGKKLGELPELVSRLPRLSEKEAAVFKKDIARTKKKSDMERMRDPWAS